MKKTFFSLFLIFALISCASPQGTNVAISTVTTTPTQSATSTISPTQTPSPIVPPESTVSIATLDAVATLDVSRNNLINQNPDLENYGTFCQPSYCYGAEISPNGRQIIITNGNTIDLFNVNSESIGKYSFYDLYGHLVGFGDGYASGIHWTNNGKYLYIATYFGDGGPEPYFGYKSSVARVNLENGNWEDTGISGVISFSPDEKHIVYSSSKNEIRVRDSQSGEENPYFAADYNLYFGNFVWSPDNKKIIFVATPEQWYEDGSRFAIYMIDLENKAILLLQESSFPFYYPVDWTDINTVALNKFQETGKWSLDLSFDPPKITP
jgi:WD40 repeat protein